MRIGNTTLVLSITCVPCHVLARQAAVPTVALRCSATHKVHVAPQPHQQREITSATAAARRESSIEFEL